MSIPLGSQAVGMRCQRREMLQMVLQLRLQRKGSEALSHRTHLPEETVVSVASQ